MVLLKVSLSLHNKIDPEAKRAIPAKGTPPVLSPFDENALEAALGIKDVQEADNLKVCPLMEFDLHRYHWLDHKAIYPLFLHAVR